VEANLQETEERFRRVFEEGPLGMAIVSPDSRILDVNESLCETLGYNAEEMKSLTASERTHPEDIAREVELTRQIFAGEIPNFRLEKRLIKKNGEILWVSLSATVIRSAEGTPLYGLGMIEDITERKRAEAELRESEERFRNMADSAPVALWVTGPDGLPTFYNKSALSFAGLTMAQLGGRNLTELVHPDDRSETQSAYSSALAERRGFRIECRILRADGEYRWVLCSGVPRFSPDGLFVGYLGTSVDITHVKRANETAIARQKLESLGVLAGGVAHDFNNLLGGILGQAELIEAELPIPSPHREEIGRIKTSAIRGAEIVRELMIYAGTESVSVGLLDLSKIVEEMLALLKVSVSKHAVIRADLGQRLPPIRANASQIQQIVLNLITNASDAIGGRDGVIRVVTKCVTRSGQSEVVSEAPRCDYLTLEVSDTGSGMSQETQARLFDPFFTTKSIGRGLGLAVVSGTVRDIGGSIHVTSELGKGTTFQIKLPCAETATVANVPFQASKVAPPLPSLALPLPSPGTGVLMVEDEGTLRQAVAKILSKTGFEVYEAADGSSAIELLRARASKINVILLDMTTPGASSREVVAEAAKARPDIRVLLTSAYSQEMIADPMSAPQIRGFICKPFQTEELVLMLRKAMSA
jgi:PAS domain S-box-containing protein